MTKSGADSSKITKITSDKKECNYIATSKESRHYRTYLANELFEIIVNAVIISAL